MPTYHMQDGSLQHRFFLSRKKIQVYGGGFANGKTAALCMKALNVAEMYPGANCLLARATYPKLNDTLRKEFFKWCPPDWIKRRPTKDDNTCYLHNGSMINFRYVAQKGKMSEDGSTTSNLLSATYDFIGVDQIEDPEITQKDFSDLLGRLRGSTAYRPASGAEDTTMPTTGPRWLVVTCNPTHNWVYKNLILPILLFNQKGIRTDDLRVHPKTHEPIIELFEGSTYTNQHNLPGDFIEALEADFKGQMRERYLLGKWAAFEGLVYPEFDTSIHTVPREQMLEHMTRCLSRHVKLTRREGYDFGISSPSCYLYSFIDEYGRVHVIDGYHKKEFKLYDQADAIKEIRNRYDFNLKTMQDIQADPDIFKRKVIATKDADTDTIADIFSDQHDIEMEPSDNDITNGISKVQSYLGNFSMLENPYTNQRGSPMIFFAQELDFIATEFQNYFWRRNPQGQFIDQPIDKDDHSPDTIKYMLARLPHPSKVIVPKSQKEPEWMFWHEVEDAA